MRQYNLGPAIDAPVVSDSVVAKQIRCHLCACFRREGQYLKEFVEYHLALGFVHVHLFDNNSGADDEEDVRNVAQNPQVTVYNKRNKKYNQKGWYQELYNTLSPDEWCMYEDIDEFVHFVKPWTLRTFVARAVANGCEQVKINWVVYGNNGHIQKTSGTMVERFPEPTRPLDFWKRKILENAHSKPLIKGGVQGATWRTVHHMHGPGMKACNGDLKRIDDNDSRFVFPMTWNTSIVRHYSTKSEQEWCEKMLRWRGKSHGWDRYDEINNLEPNAKRTGKFNAQCEYVP